MRSFLTVMVVLLMFASTQVAVAFERCDDPQCADYMGAQKKSEKKNDAGTHCAVGCYHAVAIPHDSVTAVRSAAGIAAFWAERLMPESAVGEGLIEPPSLA